VLPGLFVCCCFVHIFLCRIINPINITIQRIDELAQKEGLKEYIHNTFGGPRKLKLEILTDFFRHAFNGSGKHF